MQQVSWRADADLVVRVKRSAEQRGCSMNEFITLVLDVATDPSRAQDAHTGLRERLRLAGLLADVEEPQRPPPPRDDVLEAARRLAGDVLMSDVVIEERR